MTMSMEAEVFTRLIEASEKLKKETEKKQDAKSWKSINQSLTLEEGLNRLAKSDLDSFRRKLEIKNASSLKKAELIVVLKDEILANVGDVCKLLDDKRYNLITEMVENGGHLNASNIDLKVLAPLLENGMIFTGTVEDEKMFVMPTEIVELVSKQNDDELKNLIKRNTEWVKLTKGALYYYGSLNLNQLLAVIERFMNEPVEINEFIAMIEQVAFADSELRIEEQCFSNGRVFDSARVFQEHQNRSELGYYPFTKEQLLAAGETDFVERNESYQRFVKFLHSTFDMSQEEADNIVEECVYATRIGEEPKDLLQFLQQRVEFDRIDTLRMAMERIVDLMNNTRAWFLKGYTSSELSVQEKSSAKDNVISIQSKKKIGRNEPCPCGSGKKYKKCCGK
ncbi:SEC-C metal-binding domain-containing protein [Mesobacillus maritimus]|uniref:YecA family protein n=1 Tax=Mesobacillus maritimus TaxID=1643336 RepID=UPI00203D2675|nr:SEC-C metal-binding domain-containing protein [Mesobacillus maritimus]MCM3587444.1 SEC-C metal-binding domain-containing protein [Mesobacillus maritimus]MCM3671091.1 SEC-C metal-binding domain-containing protein [Mesobacillus maritimus]